MNNNFTNVIVKIPKPMQFIKLNFVRMFKEEILLMKEKYIIQIDQTITINGF